MDYSLNIIPFLLSQLGFWCKLGSKLFEVAQICTNDPKYYEGFTLVVFPLLVQIPLFISIYFPSYCRAVRPISLRVLSKNLVFRSYPLYLFSNFAPLNNK